MYENILSNMLGCQTYCISDSPSNRYCFIGPIECNEKLIEVFKKGITVKLKYVEKTGPGYIYGQWNRPKQLHSLYYCEAEFLSRLVTAKYKRYEQFCNRYSR